MNNVIYERIGALLIQDGVTLSGGQVDQLEAFCRLVAECNEACSLVSAGDCLRLGEIHIPDSLSLAPLVQRYAGPEGVLLDIGGGGGFPAVPISIALPGLTVYLVERSEKKAAFLRRAVEALGLSRSTVVLGEFPAAAKGLTPQVITARAVERPEKLRRQVLRYMPKGCVFLCQMPKTLGEFPATFHVERIEDNWSREGLRRGVLEIVRAEG
ncbi:MAG: class I SAM-dependent methyltransferase [Candidatus Hydrogenedentes bacterium]|nr:class I SAM-dependent methyltransferase [Candidatus Hydrogenedentota bacterium]